VSGWPICTPLAASHPRTVPSRLAEAMRFAVRAKHHTPHRAGVAGQSCADGLTGARIPYPHRVVPTGGSNAFAVGAERHTLHHVGVAGHSCADGLAGVGVPYPHRVVVAGGG